MNLDFTKSKVIVVGDVMLDRYWHGDSGRLSPEAPVPVVKVVDFEDRLGGASNVARNLASLGVRTTILGVIGYDEAGESLTAALRDAGIKTLLYKHTEAVTTVKLRILARQQQLVRIDFEEKVPKEAQDHLMELFKSNIDQYDAVIFSDYANGTLDNVQDMISHAKSKGKLALVDPKGRDYTKYIGADFIKPNVSELKEVVGEWSSEDELAVLAFKLRSDLKIDNLLLTRSEDGMTLFDRNSRIYVKPEAKEVFDVSGAGDTVMATLTAALTNGWSNKKAVEIANTAASIVVGKRGTATITLEELENNYEV